MAKKWLLRRYAAGLSDGIKRSRATMATPWQRALGHLESVFIDHACFRLIYANLHRLSPRMYRSSQPSPVHVRRAAAAGIRTIVNLRGHRDCASYILEGEACAAAGVVLENFPVNSRDMPKKETLHAARALFERIEYPALMHCKSGADRAGFMAALYLFIHEGVPLETATRQLHWKYGHFKQAKTGILDYFFELYAAYNARHPIDFWDWVDRVYDPVQAKADFRSRQWADTVVDRLLARE
ncbi:tyrosine-protein phosphatase [Azospirillum halopraeferens]|uniref:phosphatase domain-containing protein n=1 Tax=Azospirillum halopraeferens TaxID=34010 RepID=UPI000420CD29|nr:sulfur transferase domain-containing protein [Azospirillum halopraeferens]